MSRRKVVPLFTEGQEDVNRLRRLLGMIEDASTAPVVISDEAMRRAGFTVDRERGPRLVAWVNERAARKAAPTPPRTPE